MDAVTLPTETQTPTATVELLTAFRGSDLHDLCDATELAIEIAEAHGQEVLVDLALAIASVRVFPTLKRGLGYARSCSQVTVEI